MFFVYILKGNNKHYVWITNDIQKRLTEHNLWKNKTTKSMWDIQLLKTYTFPTRQEAAAFEAKIKRSGHIQRRL